MAKGTEKSADAQGGFARTPRVRCAHPPGGSKISLSFRQPSMLARRPSDVLDNLLSRFLRCSGLLSHLRSCERYDEPETLPYSIRPFRPNDVISLSRHPADLFTESSPIAQQFMVAKSPL